MDTLLAAAVHKKNVHVGGGKTFNMRKPIKLKPAGKRRKALAKGVSNDVDLKTMTHGKQQIAGEDLFTTKKPIVNRGSKVAYLNTRSMSLGNFEMGNKLLNHVLSDEKIKQCSECGLKEAIEETKCYECALKEAIEEMQCSTWYIKEDEESAFGIPFLQSNFEMGNKLSKDEYFDEKIKQCYECALKEAIKETQCSIWYIKEDKESAFCIPFLHLERPLPSVDKGYEIEDPDLHSTMSFPGPPLYTPKKLDDLLDEPLLFLNKYPVPEEFEFEDDFGIDNLWS